MRLVATKSNAKIEPIRQADCLASGSAGAGHPAGGDLAEILVVGGAWLLALVQVGIALARGGAWTPDSTLAIAFALACPLLLRALLTGSSRERGRSGNDESG
jgi:hypothetical protein